MHYAVLSKIDCTISKLRALFPELTGKRCTNDAMMMEVIGVTLNAFKVAPKI